VIFQFDFVIFNQSSFSFDNISSRQAVVVCDTYVNYISGFADEFLIQSVIAIRNQPFL
jgi:hypothetical protein